jgi:hypothetical protein
MLCIWGTGYLRNSVTNAVNRRITVYYILYIYMLYALCMYYINFHDGRWMADRFFNLIFSTCSLSILLMTYVSQQYSGLSSSVIRNKLSDSCKCTNLRFSLKTTVQRFPFLRALTYKNTTRPSVPTNKRITFRCLGVLCMMLLTKGTGPQ